MKPIEVDETLTELVVSWRRHLHAHPELSYQEEETASFVEERLREMGLRPTRVAKTGVVALVEGAREGKTVALRADMDALPIVEETGLPFSSKRPGVMHACGHDAHTAILLGAAKLLSSNREVIRGCVKLIFQPAEEAAPRGGAPSMIEAGVLDEPRVEAILGLHVWPDLPLGEIGIKEGAMSAASDPFRIEVLGKSAHASTPHYGVDAIAICGPLLSALHSIVSRQVSPTDQAVVTVGTIQGGQRYNVLADRVEMRGTARTYDPAVRDRVERAIRSAVEGICSSMGGTGVLEYNRGYPPTVNDPFVTEVMRSLIRDLFGEEALFEVRQPALGGEDFAFYAERVKGAFMWLGCRPKEVPVEEFPTLHNGRFNPDERCLPIGVKLLANGALRLLEVLG